MNRTFTKFVALVQGTAVQPTKAVWVGTAQTAFTVTDHMGNSTNFGVVNAGTQIDISIVEATTMAGTVVGLY